MFIKQPLGGAVVLSGSGAKREEGGFGRGGQKRKGAAGQQVEPRAPSELVPGQMTITEFDNEMARKEHTDLAEA